MRGARFSTLGALALAACAGLAKPGRVPALAISGFHASRIEAERALESRFSKIPDSDACARNLRRLTEEPHVAGTPANERVAQFLLDEFRACGLAAEIVEYEVLLSYP